MNRSTPGLPVHHQLPEFTQTHIHWVGDAIQPSHSLLSPFPPAPNPSQYESFPVSQLFAWGGQSIGVSALASFLPKNTQDWSPLGWTGWISLQSKGLSRVLSNTTVQKHRVFGARFLHSPTLTSIHDHWKNRLVWYILTYQNPTSSGQFSSVAQLCLFVTPWTAACQASLSFTSSLSSLKHMSFRLVMPFNLLILCCPLLFLFSVFPSIRVILNE